jgi:probable rRNA maturation factor
MIHLSNRSPSRLRGDLIRKAVAATLARFGKEGLDVEIILTDDTEMMEINRLFRQIEEPTDVLSFPAPPEIPNWLGEIAISVDFAARQAVLRHVSKSEEAAMLAIHGCLHLVGFEDDTDRGRDEMARLQAEIAAGLGFRADDDWHSLPHGPGDVR